MDEAERRQATRELGSLTALCVLAIVCNLAGPSLFWDLFDYSWLFKHLGFIACGALVAEVCSLGIWCAWGQQPIKYRVPITAALVLVAACSYTLGLQLPKSPSPGQSMPVEVAVVIVGAGFTMFAVIQVPLWLLRRSKRCRIARPATVEFGDSPQGKQFGVGYLMLWMALISVLLVLFRNTLPERSAGLPLRGLVDVIVIMLAYIGVSSLLCVPCIWIALAARPSRIAVLLLGGALIAGPFFLLACTTFIIGGPHDSEVLSGVASYEIGLSGATLLVLLVWRCLGYRVLVAP